MLKKANRYDTLCHARPAAELARLHVELGRVSKGAEWDRAAASAALAARDAELAAMKNSTSWRITYPVRLAGNAFAALTRPLRRALDRRQHDGGRDGDSR
jgi:hypothetical protein